MAGGPCSRPGTSGTAPRIATGTWTEEAEGTGRTQGPQVGGCPRKMRSRQPRRLGEEGVRRLPPAPPDENFRSERGVGDPGEAREACTCLLPPRGRDRPLVPGSPPHEAAICILPVCTSENSLLAVPTKSSVEPHELSEGHVSSGPSVHCAVWWLAAPLQKGSRPQQDIENIAWIKIRLIPPLHHTFLCTQVPRLGFLTPTCLRLAVPSGCISVS
ncbi:uncharacterized protein LOC132219148 isoform X1 [Myotis daubentonii]|uniref:uncharacterized protein LOC132219148 isoform X1 n=1 Tax=Myotis daubentonii TaxID=98922 RepID=UPI002872F8DE|nr:uncharacterized protein LOC132219148 isoform X1 [Myotis daubentonii]